LPRPNVFEPEFDGGSERPGFTMRRARLGRQAGARRLGASLYELPADQSPWPYHLHVAGDEGAHQVHNRTASAVRILVLSEMIAPEIAIYPDSGKVGVFGRAPGGKGEAIRLYLRGDSGVDYWEGEEPPGRSGG
jgi:uncharacterized cupin superfamily protein